MGEVIMTILGKQFHLAYIVAFSLVLTACGSVNKIYDDVEGRQVDAAEKADEVFQVTVDAADNSSMIEHVEDYFVADNAFEIKEEVKLPDSFAQDIVYHTADEESLLEVINTLNNQLDVDIEVVPNAIEYLSLSLGLRQLWS